MLLLSIFGFSQLGVNTEVPEAMLHIKNIGTNKKTSAVKVEGEIQKYISETTTTDREIYLDENGDLFTTPPKLLALNLIVSLSPSTDAGTNCLSTAYGPNADRESINIRRVKYDNVLFSSVNPISQVFDTTRGVFIAPKTGYYQVTTNLALKNNTPSASSGPGKQMLRLGIATRKDQESDFPFDNAGFVFLNQKLNSSGNFGGVDYLLENLSAEGVVYLKAGDEMAAGTRFITPINASGGYTCNVEDLGYKRENLSTMTIIFLTE